MKNRSYKLTAAAGMVFLVLGIAVPVSGAFAEINPTGHAGAGGGGDVVIGGSGVTVNANANARADSSADLNTKTKTRANQEITRRIKALDDLNTRVNQMTKISSSDQSAISANIQTQITAMNTLQAQIASDTAANSTTSLKTDTQSITKSYRIFALIIPQGAIEAASDRVLDIAATMTTLAGRLQTRITTAQNASTDMSASVSALADMNVKIADANTQVNAGINEIVNLQPDNGDKTLMTSNTATLKDARARVQTAQQDLAAARKDAGIIVKALASLKVSGNVSTTVTAH